MRKIERYHQIAVIDYLRHRYPSALFTIAPNGFKLPMGVAIALKRMGYLAGSPDIMIFEPRGQYHGLFIEMKAPKGQDNAKGRLSDNQKEFIQRLIERGYKVDICFGRDEAIQIIDEYFKEKL